MASLREVAPIHLTADGAAVSIYKQSRSLQLQSFHLRTNEGAVLTMFPNKLVRLERVLSLLVLVMVCFALTCTGP